MKAAGDRPGRRAVIQVRGCDVLRYRNLEAEWTLETVADKGSILQKRKPNLTGFRMRGCGPQQEKPRNENASPALERSPRSTARGEPVQQLRPAQPQRDG
ncbi:hypothetical protein MJG53_012132 [Ovis ammon polii x Ovis aries]|uniref:Uncharacterized protein n=1 Tax=Ovis ammon polii x Ovis aries TaxID=2918886 RepID=A0ACB9UQB4_9CETA|nr:hypothetical protein MJG53_012132 [Ovis ammon polii x Ovis aries]